MTDASDPGKDQGPDPGTGESVDSEMPEQVVEEVTRLTRLARRARDDAEATAYRDRRETLLAEYGYTARIREDDGDDVLVCYPSEWIEDGTVVLDRIDDVDRGVERPLSGPGDERTWESVKSRNEAVVAEIAGEHEGPHAENARALATFANNHYAKPIPALTGRELREFRTEYFPRNAFPTDEQRETLEESLRLIYERLDLPMPDDRS